MNCCHASEVVVFLNHGIAHANTSQQMLLQEPNDSILSLTSMHKRLTTFYACNLSLDAVSFRQQQESVIRRGYALGR